MSEKHTLLLKKYLQLPDRLEAAIAGLDEAGLDWKGKGGWSIRSYVHHTVEGELIWQVNSVGLPCRWTFTVTEPFTTETVVTITLCSSAACSDSVRTAMARKRRQGFTAAMYTKKPRKCC